MRHLLAVDSIAVLGAFTTGQAASAAGMEPVGPAGVATVGAPFDRQFSDELAAHHQLAIAMASTALMHARFAQTKTIARRITSDQAMEIGELTSLRVNGFGA